MISGLEVGSRNLSENIYSQEMAYINIGNGILNPALRRNGIRLVCYVCCEKFFQNGFGKSDYVLNPTAKPLSTSDLLIYCTFCQFQRISSVLNEIAL